MAVWEEAMELTAAGLVKRFGAVEALAGATFSASGDVVAILGTNGSGKTTLLTIIAGLRRPTRGELRLDGREPYKYRDWAARYVKAVFEKPRFPYPVKAGEVVDIVRRLRDCPGGIDISDISGLKIGQLSSGQAQLLGIAVALDCHDGVAVLDEPFSHLDKRRAAALAELIRSRGSVIYTTHNSVEVYLADYIVVFDRGRVVWEGPRDRFYSRYEWRIAADRAPGGCREVGREGVYVDVECTVEDLFKGLAEGYVYAVERRGVY
ncbi:MAG: ATP-binding cassette domain-containing protein [Thermoproteus sp.]